MGKFIKKVRIFFYEHYLTKILLVKFIRLKITIVIYLKYCVRVLTNYNRVELKEYPKVIQLPITYRCNFNCVMCGMINLVQNKGFSPIQLGQILNNKLFCKVLSVGINGGEPFLLNNIYEYICILLKTLPKLKDIYIISNGYFTSNILANSPLILAACHEHGVKYHLSISIDGIGEMQDTMRGKKGAFEHVNDTCLKISENRSQYCDSFGTICTITKVNVYNLAELEVWAQIRKIPMSYNVATVHKRICNDYKFNSFSVFTDKHAQMMATEFFYTKFLQTHEERYFALYYVTKYNQRIAVCEHKTKVVTITPDGGISYCATHSDEIGNAYQMQADSIYFSRQNLEYRESMHHEFCSNCSHYSSSLQPSKLISLYKNELLRATALYY